MYGYCVFHLLTCRAIFIRPSRRWWKQQGKIIETSLPEISTIYTTRCLRRAHNILRDEHRPAHHFFHLLPSGRRYRLICAATPRLAHSLHPQAVSLLNGHFWSWAMPAWRGFKRYLVVIWIRCYMAMTKKYWILNLLTYVTIFTLRFSCWHLPAGSAGHMTASALSKVSSVYMRHKHLFCAAASEVETRITPSARVYCCKVAQNVPRVCRNNGKMDTSNIDVWKAAGLNYRVQPAWQEMWADQRWVEILTSFILSSSSFKESFSIQVVDIQ